MKLIHANIFEGCQKNELRMKLKNFLLKENPDIISLNEVNGWSKEQLKNFLSEIFKYSYLYEVNSDFNLGIISKYPIEILKEEQKNFEHGYIHSKINGVHFITTHLTPYKTIDRIKEIKIILEELKDISSPVIISGDLNSLCERDYFNYRNIENDMIKDLDLKEKFFKDGNLDFEPINQILKADFIDTLNSNKFEFTVPTPLNKDKGHVYPLRIDYIFSNKYLKSVKTKTIYLDEKDLYSDHFPLMCEW